jgi:hypothetical protein
MATKPKKPVAVIKEFVTTDRFNKLEDAVNKIADSMINLTDRLSAVPVVESKEVKEIKAAGPDRVETNPNWQEQAQEILGDYLDHTEVTHTKSGGILFTIVIKPERSNASKDHLNFYKHDRRTKEVSAEGEEGVIQWCKLVLGNLKHSESASGRK